MPQVPTLVEEKFLPKATSLLKDETWSICWKGFTVLVQISHPTLARLKSPSLWALGCPGGVGEGGGGEE